MTLIQLFTAIANAIRAKTGSSEQILAENFPTEIADITTGNLSDEEYQEANDDLDEILEGTEVTKIYPPDWSKIGYEDTPQIIIDGFNYAKEIYDNWDSSETDLKNKFANDKKLTIMPLVDTSNAQNMQSMFSSCENLKTIPQLDMTNVTSVANLFNYCRNLIHVPTLNINNISNTSNMFSNCNNLTSLDATKINTSNVTSMSYMFFSCQALTSLDVSNFNTSNVTNMTSMFSNCNNLTSLDVTSFDTSKVANMGLMFYNCNNLENLDVSNFNINAITGSGSNGMFSGCSSLSNDSLNSILMMCIKGTSYTRTKTLAYIGLSSTQAETCQTLSNWDDFVTAGWTTGY